LDSDDFVFRYGSIGLIIMILSVGFLVIFPHSFEAFAQEESELAKNTKDFIDTVKGWIYGSVDESMENLDIPDNTLNFTEKEARGIVEAGKKTTDAGIELLREGHGLSGELAQGVLPPEIDPDIIFVLGVLVIGIIVVARHRRLVNDIAYIALGIIVLAIILIILQLNLN